MTNTYEIKVDGDVVATMTGDFAQASSPLTLDGDSTPFQVADAKHSVTGAAEMLLLWANSNASGSMVEVDEDGDIVGELTVEAVDFAERFAASIDHNSCREHGVICHTAEWIESSEQKTWELPTFGKVFGDRIVLWTDTDEAGVADIETRDLDGVDPEDVVREYAEEIASDLGELVEAE